MIPLFSYMAFPAIFIFVIGHVATATLPLPKPKLSRKIRIIKFGNHSKTASKSLPSREDLAFTASGEDGGLLTIGAQRYAEYSHNKNFSGIFIEFLRSFYHMLIFGIESIISEFCGLWTT